MVTKILNNSSPTSAENAIPKGDAREGRQGKALKTGRLWIWVCVWDGARNVGYTFNWNPLWVMVGRGYRRVVKSGNSEPKTHDDILPKKKRSDRRRLCVRMYRFLYLWSYIGGKLHIPLPVPIPLTPLAPYHSIYNLPLPICGSAPNIRVCNCIGVWAALVDSFARRRLCISFPPILSA